MRRTDQRLHKRLNEHRSKFYAIIGGGAFDITNDNHSLGIHLIDHGFYEHADFNRIYRICIIENCSPKSLEYKENDYIHLCKTLRPLGLNSINPFGLKLFH